MTKHLCLATAWLLLAGTLLRAQGGYYPRDTAYSIQSTYLKNLRKYPDVLPVWPALPKGVVADYNVVYATLDGGRQLHADVFRPRRRGRKPGVLMIHGGGWSGGSKENMVPMAEQLARSGYVAVVAEYRLTAEAPYPAAVQDLKAALRWMRAQAAIYNIDTLRIATYGCSAGAQLAGLLGTTQGLGMYEYHAAHRHHSDAVQAVLNIDGVVSFVHPEAAPEHSGKSANAWLGPYPDSLARWTEASPLTHAGADTPPCLFLNSSHPRFHAGRDDMVAILQRHGTYYDIHTFEGSPHSFWLLHPWFEPTHERVVRFLKRVF